MKSQENLLAFLASYRSILSLSRSFCKWLPSQSKLFTSYCQTNLTIWFLDCLVTNTMFRFISIKFIFIARKESVQADHALRECSPDNHSTPSRCHWCLSGSEFNDQTSGINASTNAIDANMDDGRVISLHAKKCRSGISNDNSLRAVSSFSSSFDA